MENWWSSVNYLFDSVRPMLVTESSHHLSCFFFTDLTWWSQTRLGESWKFLPCAIYMGYMDSRHFRKYKKLHLDPISYLLHQMITIVCGRRGTVILRELVKSDCFWKGQRAKNGFWVQTYASTRTPLRAISIYTREKVPA